MSDAHDHSELFTRAAAQIFAEVSSVTPITESKSIAQVETPSGTFALRRWPSNATPERIRFIHAVISSYVEFPFAPKLATADSGPVVRIDEHLFDATTWLDGKPLRHTERLEGLKSAVSLPCSGSVELLEELTAAVAAMHSAAQDLGKKRSTPKLPIKALIAAARGSWMQQRGRLRPIARTTPDIQRWIRTGERALPLAERILTGLPDDAMTDVVIAHANLWPEHVLIVRQGRSDRLSGVLDFKDVIATTPLLDIAQIAGRFNGWSDETAEIVIGAYSETGRLAPPERRVLPAVAALDLVIETGSILVATYAELGASYAPASLREGADMMLRSLESVTKTMERLEGINQPGPRKWVYRPRPEAERTTPRARPNRQRQPKDRSTNRPSRG